MATAQLPSHRHDEQGGHHEHEHEHSGHEHEHGDHEHSGQRAAEAEPMLAPSGDGTVVMDIGGDIGAVVLHTDSSLDGSEIDLFQLGSTTPYVHSAVRARHLSTGTRYAAVYPNLPAGDYTIAAHGSLPPTRVTVVGGRIAEAGG